MDQNSGLKAPKKLACLLVKKCDNNGLELGNIKLITLYIQFFSDQNMAKYSLSKFVM